MDCSQVNWYEDSARTQGGGWIWFPGTAKHKDLHTATNLAEGAALDYLVGECQMVHREVKFHEKCMKPIKGGFRVYVRASIKRKQCDMAKSKKVIYKNKKLTERLNQFRAYKAKNSVDTDKCNSHTPDQCFLIADDEWRLGNTILAEAYADRACQYGKRAYCGFQGYLNYKLGNKEKARRLLTRSCEVGNKHDCRTLKLIE